MAITFSCPHCGRGYKVRDDLAGKAVTCKECTQSLRVPVPARPRTRTDPDLEAAATEALTEAPASAAEPVEEIEFECSSCIEMVRVSAAFAGKQAPCPNCRRIVRVPKSSGSTPSDWRAADHRPTLARHDDKSVTGQWGNTTTTSIVSRDALAEADALRKRRPRPGPSKLKIGFWVGGTVVALALGALLWRSHRTVQHRDDFMQKALLAGDAHASPVIASAVRRAAGEYYLRAREANPAEADKMLRAARDKLSTLAAPHTDKAFERLMLLTDVAATQARLGGSAGEVQDGRRLAWSQVQPELRRTMTSLVSGAPGGDGIALAFERLAEALGSAGDKEPLAPGLIGVVFSKPDERVEPLAIFGLKFLGDGAEGRERAAAMAVQIRSLSPTVASAKAIALHVALDQLAMVPHVKPPGDGEPPLDVRLGFAEGLARRGELDAAQRVARLPGRFEDRFAAEATIAAVFEKDANPSAAFAVDLLMKELGSRDLPDWPLVRLARTCGQTPTSPAGPLFEFLQRQSNLSPRSQAVRAWAQFELLRGTNASVPVTEEAILAMTPNHTAGAMLAWEALGRRIGSSGSAPSSADAALESLRSHGLALAGIALGLLDRTP